MLATLFFLGTATAVANLPPQYPCVGGPCPGYPLPSRTAKMVPPRYLNTSNEIGSSPPHRHGVFGSVPTFMQSTWFQHDRQAVLMTLYMEATADVRLEVFGDNLCSFTKASWPTLKALADHYQSAGASLEIRVHWFPLPYHHNAYFTAMSDHYIGSKHGAAKMFAFADAVFAAQSTLLGEAVNLTEYEVKERIAGIAASIGIPNTEFMPAILNRSLDMATRVAWKYAAGSRHVYETPTFFLNGFEVPEPFKANTGTANITGWTTVIDPLLETPPMADEL